MAEIKSTLDIVLEKTKHLTLSAEEKIRPLHGFLFMLFTSSHVFPQHGIFSWS